jgi:hypothetical protein
MEDGDMEDGVDVQGIQEGKMVGNRGDDVGDGVGANEPRLKFLGGMGSLGCKVNVHGGQQNLVTNSELDIMTRLVGIAFLIGLGKGEGISGCVDVIVQGFQEIGSSRDSIRDGGEGSIQVVRVLAKVDLERTHSGGGIGGIVASEFSS